MSATDTARSIVQMASLVGKTGTIMLGGLAVDVKIQDVKVSYGKTRFLVTPLAGAGSTWVENVNTED